MKMMMLDLLKMFLMINEPMIMMMLMYYPMMKNYVIVYELSLVDFETIPKIKKKNFFVVVWYSLKHKSDWIWHVEEGYITRKKEMTPFKRKSPYVQVLFVDFWTVVQNDTSWSQQNKKVKECIWCVKQAIINLEIVPSNEPCYHNRRHMIQVENRGKSNLYVQNKMFISISRDDNKKKIFYFK
jgi:hypothetical protein